MLPSVAGTTLKYTNNNTKGKPRKMLVKLLFLKEVNETERLADFVLQKMKSGHAMDWRHQLNRLIEPESLSLSQDKSQAPFFDFTKGISTKQKVVHMKPKQKSWCAIIRDEDPTFCKLAGIKHTVTDKARKAVILTSTLKK